jgi:biotin carboxyl carrier protein
LHNLGLDNIAAKKINDIKAPMPGMVLNILVGEGQQVKKGDSLLVLEAMKMENVLKSPTDGMIKKVVAIKGTAVEKNQLLIQF